MVALACFLRLLPRTCSVSTSRSPHGRWFHTFTLQWKPAGIAHLCYRTCGTDKVLYQFLQGRFACNVYIYSLKKISIHLTQPCSHIYLLFLQRLWEQSYLVDVGSSLCLLTFWLKAECLLLGDGPQNWFRMRHIHQNPKHSPKKGGGQV